MRVYLVRHGEAESGRTGSERQLTEKGREETLRLASFMDRLGVRVRVVKHSGKLRAQQTAEILAASVRPFEGVIEVEGMMPNDEVRPWARDLGSAEEDTILVAHLPFISRLATRLLTAEERAGLFKFVPSSVLCLERNAEDDWHVSYFVTPDQL